jgi:chemotaxis protein methyltransferase CheR
MPPESGRRPPGSGRAQALEPFRLLPDDFQAIRSLIKENTGISLGPGKQDLVVSRLGKRLRALGLADFSQYVGLVSSPGGRSELVEMINQITTNKTDFFREKHHFDFLWEQALPELCQQSRPRRARAWSAGCSSGEEAYSLAMVLAEFFAGRPGWDPRLLATDLHTAMLRRASQGLYGDQEVSRIPKRLLLKYFQRRRETGRNLYQARASLREMITFGKLNLMGRQYPRREHLDIIFCRNVLIYFDAGDKQTIVSKLTKSLRPGGWLFLGHSESLLAASRHLVCVGPTVYRKR